MKNIFKLALILLAAGSFTACEEWLDVNTDPNNPTSVTPDLILPVAQFYTAGIEQADRRLNSLGNLLMYNWSQSDGYSWYTDEFKYNVTSSFYRDIFNRSYYNALKQYQELYKLGAGYEYYKAISMIMKAYHYQLLVDCYGDVPYSEALGRSINPTPKYDDAQVIYEDLIVQLTDAIALIKGADEDAQIVVPAGDDAMFGGNMTQWIRFANTVKLRILMRQSDMAGRDAYITAAINAINSEGTGYITGDVGVNPGFVEKESGKQNLIWDQLYKDYTGTETMNWKATCASDFIINYLTTTNDPRIDRLYEKPTNGHLGVPQGLLDYDTPVVDAYMYQNVSNIGPGIMKSGNQDAIIFTLAESYFNQAEAALKGYTMSASAQELYEMGVTASFEYLDLTAAQAEAYYSQTIDNVGYAVSTDPKEAIITQKWLAVNGITAEQSWFDYNRTGFPSNLPIPLNYTKTSDRPVRLMYPSDEYSGNGDNVPVQNDPAVAFNEKIFWAN